MINEDIPDDLRRVFFKPVEKLDKERVRYLSREERMAYLVKVDDKGRLTWARNGELISTSEKYRDSVEGTSTPATLPARPHH